MVKIKKGDEVIVIAGRDRGKQGTVLALEKNSKCMVTGVNMVKKHTKPNPQAGVQGGIIEKESLIDISNVAIFNPSSTETFFSFLLITGLCSFKQLITFFVI